MAPRDRRLAELADRFRGVKPPRFPTMFEALVNSFACQQLALIVGLELLNRLAAVCGVRRETGASAHDAFPAPHDVGGRPPASYRAIRFSRQKVRALLAKLLQLRGVGRWTAEYVSLRGLGRLHVFPGDDAGAQKSLAGWLGRPVPLDYAGVARAVEYWQPYAGMVYFHLLLDGLSRSGALEPAA